MRIERADVGDADILADMWVDLADEQQQYGTHLRAEENRSRIREDVLRRVITGDVLVARGEIDGSGNVAGFVSFGVETKRYDRTVERGVVYNIYVRPDCRNQGIGHDLLAAAERNLAEAGADVVSLEAMATNEDALRFYERQGYRPHRIELEKSVDDDPRGDDAGGGSDESTEDDTPADGNTRTDGSGGSTGE